MLMSWSVTVPMRHLHAMMLRVVTADETLACKMMGSTISPSSGKSWSPVGLRSLPRRHEDPLDALAVVCVGWSSATVLMTFMGAMSELRPVKYLAVFPVSLFYIMIAILTLY